MLSFSVVACGESQSEKGYNAFIKDAGLYYIGSDRTHGLSEAEFAEITRCVKQVLPRTVAIKDWEFLASVIQGSIGELRANSESPFWTQNDWTRAYADETAGVEGARSPQNFYNVLRLGLIGIKGCYS